MRAAAVLALVIYHFGFDFIPGGFTGVDVFFVISGFLITGIIRRDTAAEKFFLVNFYQRRFRLLLPALAVVVLSTLVVAPYILTNSSLVDLSKSAAGVSVFFSDVFFWQTDDYFSEAAHLKPLLHTWSLGVEQQFYLIFLLFLLSLSRLSRPAVIAGMAILFVTSYGSVL